MIPGPGMRFHSIQYQTEERGRKRSICRVNHVSDVQVLHQYDRVV